MKLQLDNLDLLNLVYVSTNNSIHFRDWFVNLEPEHKGGLKIWIEFNGYMTVGYNYEEYYFPSLFDFNTSTYLTGHPIAGTELLF